MIHVKCKLCGKVQEHYVSEDQANFIPNWAVLGYQYAEDLENFVYNFDNTYTSFSSDVRCAQCGLVWSYTLQQFWEQGVDAADEEPYWLEEEESSPEFDSPLEKGFWFYWKENCPIVLTPQLEVGRYRIDFAHIPSHTAIELDGNEYHSSQSQIANDKRRQLELERQGWRFIRFNYWDMLEEYSRLDCVVNILNFMSRES